MDAPRLFHREKLKLYVGYDHGGDERLYAAFARLFSPLYELARDNSLERALEEEDAGAFLRRVGEGPMRGSACLVVLCGARTRLSARVDWEIKAALDRGAGLVAVVFPANPGGAGDPELPERLAANFERGYAVLCRWEDLATGKADLAPRLRLALSLDKALSDNSRPPLAAGG